MRIVYLGSSASWYFRDLRRAAGERHELTALDYQQLAAWVGPDSRALGAAAALDEADAVLVRSMPPGSLEQVVLRMDLLGLAESRGTLVVNPPRAVETAVDKFLTTERLRAAGLPVPRTWVGQTAQQALQAFAALGGDVVVKPLFGSEGRGITRVSDEELAWRAFHLLERGGSVIYLQEYVRHAGWDLRVLVLGERAWAMRRVSAGDWRTNLARGAAAEPWPLDEATREVARRAARAIGAPLAGVDLLPDGQGGWSVLEVNAVPGWKGLSAALGVDIALELLEFLEGRLGRQDPARER